MEREFKAMQELSFRLRKGHTLGVVGESGSGKTTMGLTLLRLHEPTSGEVIFDGRNLFALTARERQVMRRRIQIVFQDPYASLNPRQRVLDIIADGPAAHGVDRSDARARAQTHLLNNETERDAQRGASPNASERFATHRR